MPLDLMPGLQLAPPPARGRDAGRLAFYRGLSAEDAVQRHYLQAGARLLASRWRSPRGEVDLILHDGTRHLFVEVKAAASHDLAAARMQWRQWRRIEAAAEDWLARHFDHIAIERRFDLALVDRHGAISVLEAANW